MLRVAVATSGGRDSTALLHCTVRTLSALGGETWALHVHHGLQAQADDWLEWVRKQAQRWGARFDSRRLVDQVPAGASIEAWARLRRYQALTDMAQAAGCDLVLLAHHRRDQAETWLLQALRGAGPAGLSAMPASAQRGGVTWARPWLHLPREAIETYVRRYRIRHVDDPSNDDPRYARNRLRVQVWPALASAFPDVETVLCAAAGQAQHALALAREVLELDMPGVLREGHFQVSSWLLLPPARRRNVLRGWLAQQLPRGVPDSLLQRLMDELPACKASQWVLQGIALRLYRGQLRALAAGSADGADVAEVPVDSVLRIVGPGTHSLPAWHGHFEVTATAAHGLPPCLLSEVQLRPRAGGERFRLAPRATPRSLKKQYQILSVPTWQRRGPLLFSAQGQLLFVPGLGIDAAHWAPAGEPQLGLRWVPDAEAAGDPTGQRQSGS